MISAVAFVFFLALSEGLPLEENQRKVDQGPICLDPECVISSGLILSAMDRDADPCKDFYRYACGGWLDQAEIPVWATSVSKSFHELSLSNTHIIKDILESKVPTTNEALLKAQAYYASCMDLESIEILGAPIMIELLEQLGGWGVLEELFYDTAREMPTGSDTITGTLADVSKHSKSTLFNVFIGADDKDSSRNIIHFTQPSLFLGPREYYLGGHDDLLAVYFKLGVNIAALLASDSGIDLTQEYIVPVKNKMLNIIQLERNLAEIMVPGSKLRDPFKAYHKMTLQEFSEMIPAIDVFTLLKKKFNKEISPDEEVLVPTVDYFPRLNELLGTTDVKTVTNYMKWQFVASLAYFLPSRYRETILEFRRFTTGIEAASPRWVSCAMSTDSVMGFAVGAEFVKRRHSLEIKSEIEAMINGVRQSFLDSLPMVGWMDKTTKSLAEEKAKAIVEKLIGPSWIADQTKLDKYYQKLEIGQVFLLNQVNVTSFHAEKNSARLHAPVDKNEWFMMPAEVNAYYEPQLNQIVFPAGILYTPFYTHILPMSINYGAIGWVIGHELTHGFDNTGRKYDEIGNLHNWWKDESAEAYKQHAQCVVDQYSSYIVGGIHVNGKLTLGENIADNGGIRLSLHAYETYRKQLKEPEKMLPGLQNMTPEQLFFIGAGQTWCRLSTPEREQSLLLSDPHSPGKYRVIGTFSNTEEFSEAFSCPLGSVMNPEDKCHVW